jgi:hypothetical protein
VEGLGADTWIKVGAKNGPQAETKNNSATGSRGKWPHYTRSRPSLQLRLISLAQLARGPT